jgi:maleate isomerase
METEIPAMLRRRESLDSTRFTFHSSRVRLKHVTREELAKMVGDSDRCAVELADARVDVIAYACLVALMAQGPGYFEEAENRLARVAAEGGGAAPVVSSAGALVRSIQALGASKIVVVAPYLKPIAETVVSCIADAGIEVQDYVALEVSDNLEVGRLDPLRLPGIAEQLNRSNADAVVLSACVQMPSLPAIAEAERLLGLPVLSAATATTFELLERLGLEPVVPDAGYLLSGQVRAVVPSP